MKLPPFTLVHDLDPERPGTDAAEESLGGVRPRIVADLGQPKVVRVGIWELDTHVGGLPKIIEWLNAAQPAFTFFDVQATIPAGLVSAPVRVRHWASENATVTAKERRDMADNVIAGDFYRHAERVRADLRLDYLIGLTPKMVADEGPDEIFWNHFSTSRERLVLASTYELAKFSREAGRPLEAVVGGLVVAQLLVAMEPALVFHEDRGCVFDYNEDRVSIVRIAKTPRVEAACLRKIRPATRDAAAAMIKALATYGRGGAP
jgi:hypothetical protein